MIISRRLKLMSAWDRVTFVFRLGEGTATSARNALTNRIDFVRVYRRRRGSERVKDPAGQQESAVITWLPARVPKPHQVMMAIELLKKWTKPSANRTFTAVPASSQIAFQDIVYELDTWRYKARCFRAYPL